MLIDIAAHYAKIAKGVPLTENETVDLLKELAVFRKATAHLASCQAATLESLPKSASKSERRRQIELCRTAAMLTEGNDERVNFPTSLDHAMARCQQAVISEQEISSSKTNTPC